VRQIGHIQELYLDARSTEHEIDGDVRLDKIVNSVIKESEVFFAISCLYIADILFLSPKLFSLYPKYVRCLVADGYVPGCLQP
jgi:hypothetical protein